MKRLSVKRIGRRRVANAGEGFLFQFHGAFTEKKDAVAKEKATPGSFIKTVWYQSGPRYAVISPLTNNPRKKNAIGPITVGFDRGVQKYLAHTYHSTFGNMYATGFTKKEAAKNLRDALRRARATGSWRNPRACNARVGAGMTCSRKKNHRGPHLPQGATLRPISRLPKGWTSKNPPRVELFQRHASKTGKPIGKATRVTFDDGRKVSFTERLPKRKAISQAIELLKKGYKENSSKWPVRAASDDTKFFHLALREKYPGKKFEDLTSEQRSKVLAFAQELKTGGKGATKNFYSPPPEKIRGAQGLRAVMVGRLLEKYKSLRQSGSNRTQAIRSTLKDTTAGPGARADFLKAVRKHENPRKRKNKTWMQAMGAIGSAKSAGDWMKAMGSLPGRKNARRRNYVSERIDAGSRRIVIWANTPEGPFHVLPVVNYGETVTREVGKYKTIEMARKKARAYIAKMGWTAQNPRRRNYADSTELYTKFHGRKPGRVTDTGLPTADYGNHPELGQLGKLVSITFGDADAERPWKRQVKWNGSEAPDLAAEPGGQQLYIVGGNQSLEAQLSSFPIMADKDMIDLGFAYQVEYFTRKAFDNHQPVTYYHNLGEESKEMPRLVYDRQKKRLHFVGGAYKVKPEGIVN